MFHTTFYMRRLHSLVGLVVVGVFLFEHVFTNSTVLGGAKAFNDSLAMMELIPKPIFYGLEIFAIAVPLLFHAIYGIYIAAQAKNNPGNYGYVRNWQFALQRYTAWILIPFLIWHVGYMRIWEKGMMGTHINYDLLYTYFVTGDYAILHTVLYARHDRGDLPFLQRHLDVLHDVGHRQRPARTGGHQRDGDGTLHTDESRDARLHGQLFHVKTAAKESNNG